MTGSATATATASERPSGERTTVALAVWGLGTYLLFLLTTHRWFGVDVRVVAPLLCALILLNAVLTATSPTWMAWRWAASVYGCFHGLMMTVVLYLLGGLRMSVFAITYVFPVFHAEMLRSDASALLTANVSALSFALLAWAEHRSRDPATAEASALPAAGLVLLVFVSLNFIALYVNRYGYQLRHLAARLRQLVAERTMELTQANQELAAKAHALEEKQEQLRDFVYIVTHDLKNPVSAILLTADILLSREADTLSVAGREDLERIVRLAGGTEDMIRDLLGLFKITSAPEAPRWVSLDALVGAALEHLRPQLAAKGGRVTVGALPTVWGQAQKLGHVVTNLLSNAVKYVPGDGGHIDVRGGLEDGHVVLEVADNGIGIAPEYHKGIFELFGRVPAAEQEVDGRPAAGSGVGLAIVKRIVEAHHGTVSVESRPGGGSRFVVRLPAGGGGA